MQILKMLIANKLNEDRFKRSSLIDNKEQLILINNLDKCYIKEWKYFKGLEDDDLVMTLNQETGEKEWQLPYERQVFDNSELSGEMYVIETEDGELVVSEKHRVYSGNYPKSSIISLLENISTVDCSLNLGSLDQIGQFNLSASAKIGTSLLCISCLASDSHSLRKSSGIVLINVSSLDNFSLNCSPLISAYFNTSDLLFFNSSIAYSGANNCKFSDLELDIIPLTGLGLKNDTNMFVSVTNLIFYQPSFLYLFHMPSLILSPISRACLSNSFSDSSCCNIRSFQANLSVFDSIDALTNADQFISENFFICSLVFSGTDRVIDTILSNNKFDYVNKHKNVEVFKSLGSEDLDDFTLQPIKEFYSDLSGMTTSNLEFRNSTNNLIAFFDNAGNLKLKGLLGENYANP